MQYSIAFFTGLAGLAAAAPGGWGDNTPPAYGGGWGDKTTSSTWGETTTSTWGWKPTSVCSTATITSYYDKTITVPTTGKSPRASNPMLLLTKYSRDNCLQDRDRPNYGLQDRHRHFHNREGQDLDSYGHRLQDCHW